MEYLAITSTAAAGLSAVAAVGSWSAARRANNTSAQSQATAERAYETGQRAYATAEAVARIERERWHADLTPQFEIRVDKVSELQIRLAIGLVGPVPLRGLDEIAVSISNSDDREHPASATPPPTQEQVDAHVWGPYKFTTSANGADRNGRTIDPFPLVVGHGTIRQIEPTRPPFWNDSEGGNQGWRRDYWPLPLRLVLACRKEDHEPWFVPYTVDHTDA